MKQKVIPYPETLIVHDTTTLIRYQTELKRDTIVKWYEKIVYKEAKPEIIYQQKVDTLFLQSIKFKDVMLKVNKTNNKLIIYAVNENDSVIKEFIFDDIGNNFVASSEINNVFVKSQKFYWLGIEPYMNINASFSNPINENYFNLGLRSGIDFKNKYFLKPFINYNTKEKFRFGIETSIIFK